MKKKSFFAIYLMAATLAVATVSCKKDENKPATTGKNTAKEAYSPPRIDDMNAYLRDFKDMMRNPTRDGNVMLSLDEAAWHLSSVANYDFGNADVKCSGIRIDTLYSSVSLANGHVSMSAMNEAYSTVANNIDAFLDGLNEENKNIRFVHVSITPQGDVLTSVATTYGWDHTWYWESPFWARVYCGEYYETFHPYPASVAADTLAYALNMIECHSSLGPGRVYYTPTRLVEFYYRDHIDPYGSPSYLNSRLFASNTILDVNISSNMCLYLDSYLGLGYENILPGEIIMRWNVYYYEEPPIEEYQERFWKSHHLLQVLYGERHEHEPNPNQGGI